MGKKKTPKNSYYYFIRERMRTEADEGRPVKGGFKEGSDIFCREWQSMSKEAREPYVKMANEAKERGRSNLNNKFTTTGEEYAQVDERARQKQAAQQQMESFIRYLTSRPGTGSRNYIFMKVNSSIEEIREDQSQTRVFWPLEISMAAFNLKEGLLRTYTTFVDTGKVPIGYSRLAVENAADTLIPLPGHNSFSEGCRNYKEILNKIFKFATYFLKDQEVCGMPGHQRVVFCLDAEVQPIKTGLQWMVDKLEGFDNEKYCFYVENLKVYSASKLVLAMAQKASKLNPNYNNSAAKYQLEGSAESIILRGRYDFHDEIACQFHCSEKGVLKMQNCAQSIVLRRIFMLFDEFIQPNAYGYEKTDRHKIEYVSKENVLCPEKKKNEKPEEVPVPVPDWLKDKPEVSLEEPQPQLSTSPFNDDDNLPRSGCESRIGNYVNDLSEQVPVIVNGDEPNWLKDSPDPDVSLEEPQLSTPASNTNDNRPRTGVKRRNDRRSPSPEGAYGGSWWSPPSKPRPSCSPSANEYSKEGYPPEDNDDFGWTRNSTPRRQSFEDDYPTFTFPTSQGRGSSSPSSAPSNSFGIGRGIGNRDSSSYWFEDFSNVVTNIGAGRGIGPGNRELEFLFCMDRRIYSKYCDIAHHIPIFIYNSSFNDEIVTSEIPSLLSNISELIVRLYY